MSEPGSEVAFGVGMSIIGYEVGYVRKTSADPSTSPSSSLRLDIYVTGAIITDHLDKPVGRATVSFSQGPFESGRLGAMRVDDHARKYVIFATLPWGDFAGIWAALSLNRSARLECLIEERTNNVLKFWVESEGRPRLFG